jgi:MoxR-like ATPase
MAERKRNISKFDKDSGEFVSTYENGDEDVLPAGGLIEELIEETGTVDESPDPDPVDEKMVDSVLSTYLGDEMLDKLKEHAWIQDFEEIPDADNALVFGGSTRNDIKFVQFREGENFLTDTGSKQSLASIETGSLSPAGMFSDERIKKTIEDHIARLGTTSKQGEDKRARQAKRLDNIRRINSTLTSVFGFDDPRQAEAFLAAWLMKDSTCRLSGIPGTGKTTVVESAGLLMANSYGFDTGTRFIPIRPSDPDSPFHLILKGQEYDAYLNNNTDGIRVAWNQWRFSEWYHYDSFTGKKTSWPEVTPKQCKLLGLSHPIQKSGAYLFDDTFLQKKYAIPQTTGGVTNAPKLGALDPSTYRKALLNVWLWRQEKDAMDGSKYFVYHILPINLGLEAFANGNGKITQGQKHPTNSDYKAMFDVNYNHLLAPGITVPDGSTLAEEVTKLNLRTDAGRDEGYYLREWLMSHYYDARVEDKASGRTEIKGEMLREIGIAKIDYDKRADEVLYGMDIRQVSRPDPTDAQKRISSYEFEPIPRPVVTQPVKFFNEANRSQSGVEDAILGLIAEKEVEYRGRSFRSPSFVAWMDTNPHQKGNDLAFVDRIDMELLFSTVTLGQRYIQLNAQYNPQTISTKTMEKEAISQPQDKVIFDQEIGIASDTLQKAHSLRISDLMALWKHIDTIPFNNTGGDMNNYDGLRDISLLSVMFTQRFMSKPLENQTGSETRKMSLPEAKTIHSSPLIDISKASNETLLEGGTPPGFEVNATAFGDPKSDDMETQTPTLFTRVLGFRFTKSLVKLSRAFAFLRGKDFVTRKEILDALPFVIGHRMGPARAGDDPKGRDTGLIEGGMGALTSEQELVKELIVAGYVLSTSDEDGGSGVWDPLADEAANPNSKDRKNSLLDVWDAYYQRCRSVLESAGNFTEYELKVLDPLKTAINGSGTNDLSLRTTPIHWHIAAMIVEQEKKSSEADCLRQDDGMTYAQRYTKYFKAMNAPTRNINPLTQLADSTAEEIKLDFSLYDYYYLRGKIANDPLLFTDDRTYLLGLVESRIQAFVGPSFNLSPDETSNVSYALSSYNIWNPDEELASKYIVKPNPGVAMNSTYNDAVGGYGQLFGQMDDSFDITKLMPNEDFDSMFLVDETSEFSYQMSNQKMRISGSYHHEQDFNDDFIPISASTARSPRTYLAASDAITDKFRPWTMEGVVIDPSSKTVSENNLDFEITMEDIESCLESILANPTETPEAAIQKVTPLLWMQDVFTKTGAIFCFDLRHHPTSRKASSLLLLMKEKGLVDKDATEVPGDNLRLWVWIAANIEENDDEFTKTVSLVTTYGITSGFLENTILIGNQIDLPGNFVSIDNADFYDSGDSVEALYLDSGNITENDVSAYNQLFRDAIRRSTQGA